LVHDERSVKQWSKPEYYKMVEYYINNFNNSETGVTPLHARFGSEAHKHLKLEPRLPLTAFTNEYVRELDKNLKHLQDVSMKYQQEIVAKRTATNNPERHNTYKPGDYVLRIISEKLHTNKLKPPKTGPWEVLYQKGNDVTVRHVVERVVETFHVSEVTDFTGDEAAAQKAGMLDRDQYILKTIHSYQGNPDKRTTMQFYTEWEDGTKLWKAWGDDITTTIHFQQFCEKRRELMYLLYKRADITRLKLALNNIPIQHVFPNDTVYVNIRLYGHDWYEQLNLPDWEMKRYVIEFQYTGYPAKHMTDHKQINAVCKILNETWNNRDHVWVGMWGSSKDFD